MTRKLQSWMPTLILYLGFGFGLNAQTNQECINDLDDNQSHSEQIRQLAGCLYGDGEKPVIGKVIASFMPYEDLNAFTGNQDEFSPYTSKWAPADGRDVAGSVYAFMSRNSNNVPDLRGLFIRGANDFGVTFDGNVKNPVPKARKNPDDLSVGTFQSDAFQGHRHSVEEGGIQPNIVHNQGSGPQQKAAGGTHDIRRLRLILDPIEDGKNGPPRTTSETRPKNITVFYYIRIN